MTNFLKKFFIIPLFSFFIPCNSFAYTDMQNAVVTVLNKAAGKTQTFSIPVGQSIQFEKLSILVQNCKQTDPFQAEDFFMFVDVFDDDEQVFGGWMSKNEPGDNPLQNQDYDLWLVKCE